jgi:hypothetical protein
MVFHEMLTLVISSQPPSGTFLSCREKKIFGNEYMGDGMKKQWFLRRFWGFNKFTWVYKKKSQKRELTST